MFTTESWKNLGLNVVLDFCSLAWPILSELVMLWLFMKGFWLLESWFRMLEELLESVLGAA